MSIKRILNFTKRNFKEMLRDPLSYIFGLGFPLVMLILFTVINNYTGGDTPMFESRSLVPGIIMFSFTFIMLEMSLLVSRDRVSSFLKRLYTSPMKTPEFIFGYAIPGLVLGVAQEIIALLGGLIITLIMGAEYFSFGSAILLMLSQLPILIFFIFLGILFGAALNDKSAPGISSILISAAGILGGCWMPLDMMGGFETFCRFLPFYPSVYLGRVVTGAVHAMGGQYAFDAVAKLAFIPVLLFMAISLVLACFMFYRQTNKD